MITTIAVATPATANVPAGPRPTISSTAASFAASLAGAWSSGLIGASFGKQRAHLAHLPRGHRRAGVLPGHADIRHHRGHLVVVEDVRVRRHPVRARVLARARRIAAVQHDADRVD